MPSFIHPAPHPLSNAQAPRRIVSLVPSLTELLYHFGLEQHVVGITKFCVHPQSWFRTKTRVGGTKDVKVDLVRALRPDLIIANKEENQKDQVTALMQDFPVYVSDVNSLPDALNMIQDLGRLTGRDAEAKKLAGEVAAGFAALPSIPPVDAAYLIWQSPFMTVGGDTFIHDMMLRAGLNNVFGGRKRYPAIELSELQQSGCRVVVLSSEPYPFGEKHRALLQAELPGVQVLLADGEMFSWYGSRMLLAPSYFTQLQNHLAQPF